MYFFLIIFCFPSSLIEDDYSIAQLYRRIISPSVKNEEWQKQTHARHQYLKRQSPVSRFNVASPTHSIMSAPGLLETDMALQVYTCMGAIFNKVFQHTKTLLKFSPHSIA